MKHSTALSVALLAVLFPVSSPAHAQPTVLSTCGATVVDAVLAADLDCTGYEGFAVTLAPNGKLDLAGHQLTSGPTVPDGFGGGVLCLKSCTVVGGGGSLVSGVPTSWDPNILPEGITHPYTQWGRRRGVITASDLTVTGYRHGIHGDIVKVDSANLTENDHACGGRKVEITSSTITNTGPESYQAVYGMRLRLVDTLVEGGGTGVGGNVVDLVGSTITGMRAFGVSGGSGRRLRAVDSVIEGNCLSDQVENCADIWWRGFAPRLSNTTCSTSVRYHEASRTLSTWGVCALD
ncbi:MAG: hypothetical protein ABR538_00850 [Candidatus Binatia bacterium]